jgi:hypothetical protein
MGNDELDCLVRAKKIADKTKLSGKRMSAAIWAEQLFRVIGDF